ncbi:hypothetical protein [Antarcticimicrobium luteum]|uniref:Uncharacterized protein n=1 Tax=Antarcticimicrobium luteum TaxID=2547397 RepID=A0A4V3AQ17_9RHOB|nr:hypothetical protein [Antarcticimicrobium luteum]TDK41007.1 hypothetical protein E1832_20075 [Antarcticimicrobium luteum]
MISQVLNSPAFQNGFWVFVGIVAGAFIQYFLGYLQGRKQAKNALKVMQIEIEYNLGEVKALLDHIEWMRSRISAGQILVGDLFFPMEKFDYSSIAPLANSGYFHILLGPERVKKYLEFNNFFRVENGSSLTSMLRTEHGAENSLNFLDNVKVRALELAKGLDQIANSRLTFVRLKLVPKKSGE